MPAHHNESRSARWKRSSTAIALICAATLSVSADSFARGWDDDFRDWWHRDGSRDLRRVDAKDLRIETLSAKPYLVSGGDVLVRIHVPDNVSIHRVEIELNGRDITRRFRADSRTTLTGLVSGLRVGKNTLEAVVSDRGHRRTSERLTLTNYPITGPMISGPHQTPYVCTTATFTLPDGSSLGAPLDDNCSVQTRVDYIYRTNTTPASFKPLPVLSERPADLAFTTTIEGANVPYIVRVETGTINRAIYQTGILHDPRNDPAPSPFAPPSGWNGKLIYPLGGGCQGGWYTQGAFAINFPGLGTIPLVDVLNDAWLRKGYAVASSTLNIFANNCNDLLSSETIIMVKERFIESYGVPRFTIGTGGSGGAYQSNQTADNFPGVFDGIITSSSFPDVTTGVINLADARLLDIYFNMSRPGQYTVEQQKAISGFSQVGNILFLSRSPNTSALRLDPDATFWLGGFPTELRYDPVNNPGGARATVYDHTVNVYGRIPGTPGARIRAAAARQRWGSIRFEGAERRRDLGRSVP